MCIDGDETAGSRLERVLHFPIPAFWGSISIAGYPVPLYYYLFLDELLSSHFWAVFCFVQERKKEEKEEEVWVGYG